MSVARGHPEADLQRDIVKALRLALPFGAIVHASNNEIRGSSDWAKRQQALMTSMGQHAGFSDLIIFSEGRVLFLEVKTPTGSMSLSQRQFRGAVEGQGHGFAIVRSIDDALAALREFNFKTRIVYG